MPLERNIFCNKESITEYLKCPWFVDEFTGEAHPVSSFEIDETTGDYKFIKFKDGYVYQDIMIDNLRPANIFVASGMANANKEYPYLLVFSGQYVKITNYHFTNDASIYFSMVSNTGYIEHLGYNFDIEIITPQEYFVNTSKSYRESNPELKEKYYIGMD